MQNQKLVSRLASGEVLPRIWIARKNLLNVLLVAVMLVIVGTVSYAASPNLLKNGDFETGFDENGVGEYWTAFDNAGAANYGWSPDTWKPTLYDGEYSQLLGLNTHSQSEVTKNHFLGIYQQAEVKPGNEYELVMHGAVRSSKGSRENSDWSYVVQWAIAYDGSTDYEGFEESDWVDVEWHENPMEKLEGLESYSERIEIPANAESKVTLFIRGWDKWGYANSEAAFNLDGISFHVAPPADLPPTGVALSGAAVARIGFIILIGVAIGIAIFKKRTIA